MPEFDELDVETIMRTTSRDTSKDYVVNGYVQGQKAKIVLDSGAQKTILSKNFYNSLKQPPKLKKQVKLVGFHSDFSLRGNYTTVKLAIGKFVEKMPVIVAESDSDLLLGKDFFDKNLCCLDLQQEQ